MSHIVILNVSSHCNAYIDGIVIIVLKCCMCCYLVFSTSQDLSVSEELHFSVQIFWLAGFSDVHFIESIKLSFNE